MKKLLLISNRMMHYRVSLYNYFSRRFNEFGWNLTVFTNELQNNNKIPIQFNYKILPFEIKTYVKFINEIKPDAVILFLHLSKDPIIWFLIHWLKLKGIPIAFWTKGANLDAPNDKLSKMCYNYLHTVFDGIILYSSAETRLIKEKNRKKIFVANNTVNFADYPVINESKSKIKEQLGIPFQKVVLFVGRMGIHKERKKPGHLIEIFRNCQRDDTGLVIVGSGLSDELQERMNPENTMYLGEIHDPDQVQISRIFKMADLCSIPGHVGLGINQAFFWGLPIVTENGGQPPEISYLKNGQNGYIVPENDINQLQEKIFYLLNNDDIRSRFSQCARQYILENASIEKMFEGFFNCVNYLTENKQ